MTARIPVEFEDLASVTLIHEFDGTWGVFASARGPHDGLKSYGHVDAFAAFEAVAGWLISNQSAPGQDSLPLEDAAGGIKDSTAPKPVPPLAVRRARQKRRTARLRKTDK